MRYQYEFRFEMNMEVFFYQRLWSDQKQNNDNQNIEINTNFHQNIAEKILSYFQQIKKCG